MRNNTLKKWLDLATPVQRQELAKLAGTSTAYLSHLVAGDETNHKREPKPTLAAAIERATTKMQRKDARLPVVFRTELNSACAQCEFAKRCMKGLE